ncbi:MAG TPA: excinuclease ABC subunit UvrC [Candidatus Anoxymicrobiaceae bacterium]
MKPALRDKLRTLPARPGVYVFSNAAGRVIYVGKAKELSNRVSSYFRAPAAGDYKGEALRGEIAELEVTVCETEVDALILEATLIKKYLPRYNIILRDDKSYPYIAVYMRDSYPRIMLTRGKRVKGVKYYGPYVNARAARNTIRLLKKVFPLRHCIGVEPGSAGHSPCLYFEMDMCLGPCRGNVEEAEYMKQVKQFCDFLEGRYAEVLLELDTRMRAASREEEYEQAARIRNQIESARQVLRHHRSLSSTTQDYDVVGFFSDGMQACFSVAQNRAGLHLGNLVFFTDLAVAGEPAELVGEFLKRYYDQAGSIPEIVIVPAMPPDDAGLSEWLGAQRGAGVEIRVPMKGKKKHELTLAAANAKLALEGAKVARARDKGRVEAALAEISRDLELTRFPLRIECYDISTFAGTASVGSMVVFQDGYPSRREYRKFSIKFTPGVDDVGMMREVLYRRFRRARGEAALQGSQKPTGWAKMPDLVVLDGGKGQLNAALEVMKVMDITGIEVAALAKRLEEVYRPGRKEPARLPRDSEALFLLQRMRDEAHRVAVSYNRSLMERATSSSWLDQVTGVGPGRKKVLLKYFGSPRRVAAASLADLESVPGVPRAVAEAVHQAALAIKESEQI